MNAPAVPASTLLLVRDGARGLEVLMTARNAAAGFAGGAWVFPGGKVETHDAELKDRCRLAPGMDDQRVGQCVAALRETYEESGILLASEQGRAEMIASAPKGDGDFAALVRGKGLELRVDTLVRLAHWITPVSAPKRFDTQFLIAAAPPGQEARHDGHEAVDTMWVTPADAVARSEAKTARMVFVTVMILRRLSNHRSVADALAAARADRIVTVMPDIVQTPAGQVFRIPADAGYEPLEVPVTAVARP